MVLILMARAVTIMAEVEMGTEMRKAKTEMMRMMRKGWG